MNRNQSSAESVAQVEAVLATREEASRTKDIDLLMSLYAPDIVYFDVVPPLHYTGTEAVRGNFVRWFDEYDGPIELETHDLELAVGDDVAFVHMLHRDTGAVGPDDGGDDEHQRELWLRSTVCLRRIDDRWLITHEHISLPVDLATMKAG